MESPATKKRRLFYGHCASRYIKQAESNTLRAFLPDDDLPGLLHLVTVPGDINPNTMSQNNKHNRKKRTASQDFSSGPRDVVEKTGDNEAGSSALTLLLRSTPPRRDADESVMIR
jgi:hypothetical protein